MAGYIRALFIVLVSLGFASVGAVEDPAIGSGLEWLASRAQPDGGYAADGDTATGFQATADALRTFLAIDPASAQDAAGTLQHLAEEPYTGTEYVARRIVLLAQAALPSNNLLEILLSNQNPDRGFAGGPGLQSTVLDTAHALEALHMAGELGSPVAAAAVDYLRSTQTTDGGWNDIGGEPSVFVTALALRALWHGRRVYAVGDVLDGAQTWLLAQWGSGYWSEDFETALSLLAVLPRLSDSLPIVDALTALRAAQQPDGSWGRDVYTTALALRALALAGKATPNPDLGTLQGRVLDADTGLGLAGVSVRLEGASVGVQTSDASGTFRFDLLAKGDYRLTVELADYELLALSAGLSSGETRDLGPLALNKTVDATTGTVRGRVTDAETGLPIAGADLTTNQGFVSFSDADGNYQLVGVSAGSVTVSASHPNFHTVSGTAMLGDGATLVFSPVLRRNIGTEPPEAALFGLVAEAETGLPLAGAAVTFSYGGSDSQTVLTDADGTYVLALPTSGSGTVTVDLVGYDKVSAPISIYSGQSVELSPVLYAEAATPPGANAASLHGTVIDAAIGTPLEGVVVVAVYGENTVTGVTDSGGEFRISGITASEVELRFEQTDYAPRVLALPVRPLVDQDVGHVRLRRYDDGTLLPNLVIHSLDQSERVTDPQTLALNGTLGALVANSGPVRTNREFALTAFYDANSDGRFDLGQDALLGQALYAQAMDVGDEARVDIPLTGELPFRDAPVSVWVDAGQQVAEQNEDDNVAETGCIAECLFVDNFEDGDDEGWTTVHNNLGGNRPWQVVDGTYQTDGGSAAWYGDPEWDDYTAEMSMQFPNGASNDAAFEVRFQDEENYYKVAIKRHHARLVTRVDGAGAVLMEVPLLVERATWYRIRFEVFGISLKVYIDDRLLFDYSGLLLDHGAVGIHNDGVAVAYDDLQVDVCYPKPPLTVEEGFVSGDAHNWTQIANQLGSRTDWTIQRGHFSAAGGGGAWTGDTTWRDYTASGLIRFPEGAFNDAGLLFRYQDEDNWYRFGIRDGLARLISRIDGQVNDRVTEDQVYVETNRWYGLRVELEGDRVLAFLDGTLLFDFEGLLLTHGAAGFMNDGLRVDHDDFRAGPPADRPARADLSVGRLRMTGGPAEDFYRLSVRVGNANAGSLPVHASVAFYQGDTATPGTLLGMVSVTDLSGGEYRDLYLDPARLDGTAPIHAVIDPENAIDECDETNNRVTVATEAFSALAAIEVDVDRPEYFPHSLIGFSTSLENRGLVAGDFGVELRMEDLDGELIATIDLAPISALPPGAMQRLSASWDTGTVLAGDYLVRALLYDGVGTLVGAARADFAIVSDAGPLAALDIVADRPRYHTTDRLQIAATVRNRTENRVLAGTRVALEVRAPDGGVVQSAELALADLAPGGLRQSVFPQDLLQASEGGYAVDARLLAANGGVLAEAQTGFEVREDSALVLTGTIVVASRTLQRGDTQLCTETLRYTGTRTLNAQPVRHLLIRLVAGEDSPLEQRSEQIAIEPGGAHTWVRDLQTGGLTLDDYACVLQAEIDGVWSTLDYAPFSLTVPPIDIRGSLDVGQGARLLVLLDESRRCRGQGSRHRDDDEDDDDEGSDGESCAAVERVFLEGLLDAAGWSYRLVADAEVFAREFHGGGYGLYLLQSADLKLPERIQQELVEAVYNGAGLVISGSHDERNQYLDNALGIAQKGKLSRAGGVELTGADPFAPEQGDFGLEAHPLKVRLKGAEALGFYIEKDGVLTGEPAIAGHNYGDGRSLFFGFDLLAEATQGGDPDGLFALLLLSALVDSEPDTRDTAPAAVRPLALVLENHGIATEGRVQLTLPEDMAVVDSGAAREDSPQTLTWLFSLDEAEAVSLTSWVRLPDAELPLVLDALVQTGQEPDWDDHLSLTLDLAPVGPPGIDAARVAMAVDDVFKKPLKYLDTAVARLAAGDPDKALDYLLKSARELESIATPGAAQIRHWVDNAIAETAVAIADSAKDEDVK